MSGELEKIIKKIEQNYSPFSVFLYGSRARKDFLERSDFEVGVLYKRGKKVSRSELKEINLHKNINIYPFEYEDFLEYKLDTPFPEKIYVRELIEGGKTISGEKVIEKMQLPPITILDILQRARFDTAMALASLLSYRSGDMITSQMEFSKSCLFGVRSLIILEQGRFPLTYDEIFEASKRLELGEYSNVVQHAIDVRKGEKLEEAQIYKNISLLNKAVKDRIVEKFTETGNITLMN